MGTCWVANYGRAVLDRTGFEVIAACAATPCHAWPTPRVADMTAQRRRIAISPNLPHLLGLNQFFIDPVRP